MKFWFHFVAIVLTIAALAAPAADDKRLSIYAPQASYAINVLERDGREYVPLLDVLASLGNASARQDGDKWKLKFNNTDSEFKNDRTKAKVNRKHVELAAPFVIESGRGLVPLRSLGMVLSHLARGPVEVRENARRVFIGGVATQYTTELQQPGPKLVLHFSAPVNPSIATEPGRLRMMFMREPVVASVGAQTFDDKTIRSANFSEHDSIAELTVHASAPLLATFSEQNRTITISPAPQARPQAAAPPASAPPAVAPQTQPGQEGGPAPAAPVVRARATVVIDPGHGGEDRGAALSETLAEKDVALAWARRLRAALEQKGIPATLLREGDTSLSTDQRAALANAARPLVFVTLHAGTTGKGVRIFTAHLGESAPRAATFLPWDTAQAAFMDASRAVAGSLAAELTKRSIPVGTAPVLLRPLKNVAAPAVAIEVMPPAADVNGLLSGTYQQAVCTSLADGIAAVVKPAPPRPGAGGGK